MGNQYEHMADEYLEITINKIIRAAVEFERFAHDLRDLAGTLASRPGYADHAQITVEQLGNTINAAQLERVVAMAARADTNRALADLARQQEASR